MLMDFILLSTYQGQDDMCQALGIHANYDHKKQKQKSSSPLTEEETEAQVDLPRFHT